ncbi:response regulator [Flavobacterium enshiense]|uniref:response regulator n=1 Tax=Flavobacterium enshiense TaxID=1341165 RepID=UPI00345DBFD3
MLKANNLSTYSKSLLLITLSSFSFIVLLFSLYYYILKEEKEVRKSSAYQFEKEVNSLLILNSESHVSIISDISYWDELVKFTRNENQKWFYQSIGSAIDVYRVEYLGVYNLKNKLVGHATRNNFKTQSLVTEGFLNKLYKKKYIKYYTQTPEGVVEVFGATIHPSNDPLKTKTEPAGYFIMGRLLEDSYIKDLEKISGSKIVFLDKNHPIEETPNDIEVVTKLRDWENNTVAQMQFNRPFTVSFAKAKTILNIILAVFMINLVITVFYSRKWLYLPLRLITKTLETGNKKSIALLRKIPGEFGYIGNLFFENNAQKVQLEIAKEKAEESNRLKASFLTNLSHEIRTPMNAIVGFADLLKNKDLTDEERKEYIDVIDQSGSNLVSIIDDLIEMSRIDSKLITPNYGSVNLEDCVHELYKSIKITIPKDKAIDFIITECTLPLKHNIITDEIKLKQIIINLITNAIKFTDEGFVRFGYYLNKETKKIEFRIEDTGLGIDIKHHDIIFDRFKRVEGDYSIKVGGLGLGLSISKAYVEMLGGEIELVKSKLGKGSVFKFTIPYKPDESDKKGVEVEEKIDIKEIDGSETILIAEDDNINFLLLEKIMKLKHYNIIRAKNGEEAILLAKNNTIDLILMDIKMPVLSGYDATLAIRKKDKKIPIIAQTAYSTLEEVNEIMKAGFTDYISKPINKESLFLLLKKHLSEKK